MTTTIQIIMRFSKNHSRNVLCFVEIYDIFTYMMLTLFGRVGWQAGPCFLLGRSDLMDAMKISVAKLQYNGKLYTTFKPGQSILIIISDPASAYVYVLQFHVILHVFEV